jgi:hypothetical protein
MFLIQTIDGLIREDSCLEIYNQRQGECVLTDIADLADVEIRTCPVGTVEFVHAAMAVAGRQPPKPMNIPTQLHTKEFLKRKVVYTTHDGVDLDEENFVKQVDIVKGYAGQTPTADKIPEGVYLVSELVDIESEWRCFVCDGRITDVRRYASCYDAATPDWELAKKMVKAFTSAPPAWTLDVGVGPLGTFVIECHHFYSCGLYGCCSSLLPYMHKSWWNWYYNEKSATA